MTMTAKPKLLFHVQHMLGIGHRVRAERIAQACLEAGFAVTLMEGGVPGQIKAQENPDLTRIQLPPARWSDAGFSEIIDVLTDKPIDDAWRARRKALALETLHQVRPDILLVEGFPFARRAFRFELLPLIDQARSLGAGTAVSLRDILVMRRDPLKSTQIAELARSHFDTVLVHGDPGFCQLADSFSATAPLANRIRYTGIVSPDPAEPAPDTHGEIVLSAGGGATGGALVLAALKARALSTERDRPWRILIGPNLPDSVRFALVDAPDGFVVQPARKDFTAVLTSAALSISQAGYNTVADLAVSGCPAVLVPFEGPEGTETEQPTRARLMAATGRAVCIGERDLTPENLAAAVDRAMTIPRSAETPYRIGGAAETARVLLGMLEKARG